MRALIVYESSFGTTAQVADAVAAGLRSAGTEVSVVDAAGAPAVPAPAGYDLLVVGAPTHNLGLSKPRSRAQAVERGAERAAASGVAASGVAEWLEALPKLGGVRAAAFDTVVASAFSGSAAKKIEKRLASLGASVVERAEFTVAGSPPTLAEGELDRARAWGVRLGEPA